MTNRIVPAVLDETSLFGRNVYKAVPKEEVIGLVDKVTYRDGCGASPIAVLTGSAIMDRDNPEVTEEVLEDMKNFVVLRQGTDTLLTTKEQLEVVLSTLK